MAPPSGEANNQDVFVWALYLLGGSDKDVDVEDVYLKSFDLAPARLGWRTRPDLPDYKKTSKALQTVEATSHVGLVQKQGAYKRRLTAEGVRWVERNLDTLRSTYESRARVPGVAAGQYERQRRRLRESRAFKGWIGGMALEPVDLADALECSAASPGPVWRARIEEIKRSADVLSDDELRRFAMQAASDLESRGML